MKNTEILQKTESFVKTFLEGEGNGHDWWHIYRVRKLALAIAEKEGGDLFIIEMAALLHDVDDYKLIKENKESKNALNWLNKLQLPDKTIHHILSIIDEVSFKGNGVEDYTSSLECDIVQDADRLDAIGAIGIARAFAYGGSKKRLLYDPSERPAIYKSLEEYKKNTGSTINHFYEKLLLLKDRINTITGKKLAKNRHTYMEQFLKQFFNEWDAKL
ncbi:MAG: HD domain-containing protein [Mariniphaga sp.]|nr:HD domain-containing protein [Mariniphaga sp.]